MAATKLNRAPMILSCPNCDTRYRANAGAIGVNGRRVKCAACAHIWTARNEEEPVLEAIDPIPDNPPPEPEPATPKAPHQAFRERAEQKKQHQLKTAAAGAWGGLAVAIAGVFAASFLFRADIVSVWPRASSAYAAVGIDANAYGVAINDLSVERGEEHGIPTVILSGEVRNIDRQARHVPQLQARLIGEDGASVLEWTVVLDGDPMAPGERRSFTTVATDPPESAIEAEVTLAGLMPADDAAEAHEARPDGPETHTPSENGH
jgi:predicted Zn finger-like uncharacterized protein